MKLGKAVGTIGGLTMVSRILGFGREIVMARVLGANMFADAFLVAFRLPNTFRRFFGEGAFSAGFVPLFSQRYHGEGGIEEGMEARVSRLPSRGETPGVCAPNLRRDA